MKYERRPEKAKSNSWELRIVLGGLLFIGGIMQGLKGRLDLLLVGGAIGAVLVVWGFMTKPDPEDSQNVAPTQAAAVSTLSQPVTTSSHTSVTTPTVRKEYVQGYPLAYNCVLDFTPAEGVNISQLLGGKDLEATVRSAQEWIEYIVDDAIVGRTHNADKARMVSDFERNGEPCLAYIIPSGDKVNLRFYRDRRKGQEWREQEVVELVSYKSRECQENIYYLTNGDPLELDEDDKPGLVLWHGTPIGKLPAKTFKRASEDDYYGIFFEGYETVDLEYDPLDEHWEDKPTEQYVPSVRVIWLESAK